MRAVDYLRRYPLGSFAVAGGVLGVLIGLLWPTDTALAATAPEEKLVLPTRQQITRFNEAEFAKVRDGRLWAGSGSGQSQNAKMSGWRLLGILVRPAQAAFIQVDKGKKTEQVAVGEQLPDGATLLGVAATSIEFDRRGCRFQRALYAVEDVPVGGSGCPADSERANGTANQRKPN